MNNLPDGCSLRDIDDAAADRYSDMDDGYDETEDDDYELPSINVQHKYEIIKPSEANQ